MTYTAHDISRVRRQVLDAWADLVAEGGVGAFTLADVAKRAGLARSSVYRYFPNKESLYLAHLQDRIAGVVDALRAEATPNPDAPSRLRHLIVGEMRHLAQFPEVALSDVPELLSREGRRRLLECFEPLRGLVREILEQGQNDGSLNVLDVDKALPVVFACIDVFREHLSGQPVERDQIADDVADFVLRGLGAPGAGRSKGVAPQPVGRSSRRAVRR